MFRISFVILFPTKKGGVGGKEMYALVLEFRVSIIDKYFKERREVENKYLVRDVRVGKWDRFQVSSFGLQSRIKGVSR